MAKLSDLVKLRDTTFLTIQGTKVPADFTFDSIAAIEEVYGKKYTDFERDLNALLKKKRITSEPKTLKIVWSLVYGLLIGGGTETTYEEMNRAVPFKDIPNIVAEAMEILSQQDFQATDQKK